MSIIFLFQLILFEEFKQSFAEDFNLFGEAGQAYSIEISIGRPGQKLNVIVDTGSATLAIASYLRPDSDKYFHLKNSTSIYDSGQEIQAQYSQGTWVGKLVSDYVHFPSMLNVPEVRCDIALITKSHKFFMNGSGWQGLLGLAYLPVGAWGDNVIVGSWLDSMDHMLNKPMSFELKLCSVQGVTNATHYGNLKILDDQMVDKQSFMFRTPVLRKRWFVVGVLSVQVMSDTVSSEAHKLNIKNNATYNVTQSRSVYEINEEICQRMNEQKSIVDSGTTNIRLPDEMFRQVVNDLRNAAQTSNVLILDEFWYHGEAACWPEPQRWSLPRLAIHLLDFDAENQYFTLELPPQNYMRVVSARNNSGSGGSVSEFCYKLGLEAGGKETVLGYTAMEGLQNYMRVVSARNNSGSGGSVSEFCYKLGLEAGGKETVLGYTAMEGLQVVFNRSAGWIGWKTSNCGPNATISGPYNTSSSLLVRCKLIEPLSDAAISIKAAQWTLFVISMVALGVLVYLLTPCIKMLIMKPLPRSQQISLSQAALVEQEGT
ncbi:Beta-secretase 1 [Papilio machaon]|uniref:Beta-secretase 1 n=1 Tax=Papilio machaon TaxID=76193 RepID=A0A194QP43_PAPMA|nr:Beta-secretase 1 [Papilio machaon]